MLSLWIYLKSVFGFWWLYMTAGPFVLDEILKRFFPEKWVGLKNFMSAALRRKIEIGFIIIGFLFATFMAFNEQCDQNQILLKNESTSIAWEPLSDKQLSDFENGLKTITVRPPIKILCTMDSVGCSHLAHSLAIAFGVVNWPPAVDGYFESKRSLVVSIPTGLFLRRNNTTQLIQASIKSSTTLPVELTDDPDFSQNPIELVIAKKP
jgi:hypothetical protein